MTQSFQTFNPEQSTIHPNDEMILVQNKSGEPAVWQANGQIVRLEKYGAAGARKTMPRWVYQLGLRQPGYELAQVAPGDADRAFEEEQKLKLETDIAAQKAAIKAAEAKLKELEAQEKKKPEEPKK